MSLIQGTTKSASTTEFYTHKIDQSLRFNDNDSAHLTRTPSVSSNRNTLTYSTRFKRGNIQDSMLFSCQISSADKVQIRMFNNKLQLFTRTGLGTDATLEPSRVFRDCSAWYHLVFVIDTTQVTAADRFKIYVNGEMETSFTTATYPPQNANVAVNSTTQHQIGYDAPNVTSAMDGYSAATQLIDGQALDADAFGEFKNGVWVPKEYTGSYGTNGFHLDFANPADIGNDVSGNDNDWTPVNLAATDVLLDSPTNKYCTLNPLTLHNTQATLHDGNLNMKGASGASNWGTCFSTFNLPSSGKFYMECSVDILTGTGNWGGIGVIDSTQFSPSNTNVVWSETDGEGFDGAALNLVTDVLDPKSDGVTVHQVTGLTNNSYMLMMAVDVDAGKIWIGYDGTWVNSGDPVAGTGQIADRLFSTSDVIAAHTSWNGSLDSQVTINFGQSDFAHVPPTDYLTLCANNLPEPVIGPNSETQAKDHFNVVLHTGDGAVSHPITGVGFQPDLVNTKERSAVNSHQLVDAVRGANKALWTDLTGAEFTYTNHLLSFDTDGFTLGSNPNVNKLNGSFVDWCWKMGGAGVVNNNGTIQSTVSANTLAGQSIVAYTGAQNNGDTVGHGLLEPLDFIASKSRGNVNGWPVYHREIGATQFLRLNQTAAAQTSVFPWNNTEPTSSVFTLNANDENNTSGQPIIAYCYHSVEGYSKFGSYYDAAGGEHFVYTGGKPMYVRIKYTTAGAVNWMVYDGTRSPDNLAVEFLNSNTAEAEKTTLGIDILSNGFKIRGASSGNDAISFGGTGTFIYEVIMEVPFKYANAN